MIRRLFTRKPKVNDEFIINERNQHELIGYLFRDISGHIDKDCQGELVKDYSKYPSK